MSNFLGYYIMPHAPILISKIGKGKELSVKKTYDACDFIAREISYSKPNVIIMITSHGIILNDAITISCEENIYGNFEKFRAPDIKFEEKIEVNLSNEILKEAKKQNISIIGTNSSLLKDNNLLYELDHGSMVPLSFINKYYEDYEIIHISYGLISKYQLYKLGMCIERVFNRSEKSCVILASGDLSHKLSEDGPYGFSPYGKEFDTEIVKKLSECDVEGIFSMNNILINEATQCGLRCFYVLLGAMDNYAIKGELLSYEDTFGVGYCCMKFFVTPEKNSTYINLIKIHERFNTLNNSEDDTFVRLAKESLAHYIMFNEYLDPPEYIDTTYLNCKSGVFVSIKEYGRLRGCIGTVLASTQSIVHEIIQNAVKAGLCDPRFAPIKEEDLYELDFSVDILSTPQIADISDLDPEKYGIIVSTGDKRGLLLPRLDGIDTVYKQLEIALQKADIDPDEHYVIEKFIVTRHE